MKADQKNERRKFLKKLIFGGVAAIPALSLFRLKSFQAFAGTPDLDPKAANAAKLGYVTDVKHADKMHKKGSFCNNCALYQKATSTCPIFAGFKVSPKGWCKSWVPKAS